MTLTRWSRRAAALSVEALEDRLTPATLLNPTTLLYTDVDGDEVTVSVSQGTLSLAQFTFAASGDGEQLQKIQLGAENEEDLPVVNSPFSGANLTVAVRARAPLGDGQANVGFINALGIDLGRVLVVGDLGRIVVGDEDGATKALKSLSVTSLGAEGIATQEDSVDGVSLASTFSGSVGTIHVQEDIIDASLFIQGARGLLTPRAARASFAELAPTLDTLEVGGSLRGGEFELSGFVLCEGIIGEVHIGGNIEGGVGFQSGGVAATLRILTIRVDGDVLGNEGFESGAIFAGRRIVAAHIGGDVRGGTGIGSGAVAASKIEALDIDGSVVGGVGDESGKINDFSPFFLPRFVQRPVTGHLGAIHIGGDLLGGEGFASGSIRSAFLDQLVIGGDIVGGGEPGAVTADRIGELIVGGSVRGTEGFPVQITAPGRSGFIAFTFLRRISETVFVDVELPDGSVVKEPRIIFRIIAQTANLFVHRAARIDRVEVLGNVRNARITAGVLGSIGDVVVRCNWIASDLAADVLPGSDGFFGTRDDEGIRRIELPPGTPPTPEAGRIDRITIGGHVRGTTADGDHFGFTARQIDAFFSLDTDLRPGPGNDNIPLGTTGDVRLREIITGE